MRWNILVSFTESRSIEKLDHGWKSNSLSFTDIKYTPGGVCLSKVHPLVIPPHWGHLFNQHLDQETEPEFEASSPAIQYLSHPRKPGPHSNAKVNWASLHTLLEGECATCAACCPPLSLSFMFVTFSHMVLSSFNCLFSLSYDIPLQFSLSVLGEGTGARTLLPRLIPKSPEAQVPYITWHNICI